MRHKKRPHIDNMRLSLPHPVPEFLRKYGVLLVCILAGITVGAASILINPLYLLAGVGAALIGLWFVRSLDRALLALILIISLLPRFALPARLAGFTPTLLDLAIIAVLITWRVSKTPLPVPRLTLTVPLICLIVVAIATFIVGLPNGALTPLVIRRFAELLLSFGMVWVLAAALRAPAAQTRWLRIAVLAGALSAAIGIALYVIPDVLAMNLLSALRPFGYPDGPGVLRYIQDNPELSQRATGLWIDPNAFGGYLLITAALALPQVFTKAPIMRRTLVVLCVGVIGLALVLTVSRGAMLGFVTIAVLMGVLKYRRMLPLMVLVLILALILPQTRALMLHFADGFAGRDQATLMRFGEYKDALRLIERYPLLGVGFIDTPDIDLYIGVSSMYLLIAQQMGLLGLSAFALVLLVLFARAIQRWRTVQTDEGASAIFLGAHSAVLGALLSGIFDHYFFNIDFHTSAMLLWAMIALAAVSGDQRMNGHESADPLVIR